MMVPVVKQSSRRPPFVARVLVRLLVPARHREFVLGDLEEEFALSSRAGGGLSRARRRYWRLALASIAAFVFRSRPRRTSEARPSRGGWPMHGFRRDLMHGLRQLRRRPGFTLVAVLTLGLGLGATTAVFSLANWLLLRPVPGVAGQDRLITVEFSAPDGNTTGISAQNLADLSAAATTLSGMAGWQGQGLQVMGTDGRPLSLVGEAAGGDYFALLGVRPRLGRLLEPAESEPGRASYVAVISGALWRSLFGADPEVIGKVLQVNRHPLTIVGVAPDGFRGVARNGQSDVWFPSSIYGQVRHFGDPDLMNRRSAGIFIAGIIGRLVPGATAAMAETQLRQIMERLVAAYPGENENYTHYTPRAFEGVGLSSRSHDYLRRTVRLLLVVVALVLVIACANIANMLVTRGVERRGEAAVRRALGATGGRLMRQQLTESLLLSIAGGAVGIGVAFAFRALFQGTRMGPFQLEGVPFDSRVFAFAFLAALATGVVFGLVPTALSRRLDLTAALRETGGRDTRPRAYLRSAMTIVQLSLSVTLLVGALLMTRTLLNLQAVDVGFDVSDVYSFTIDTEPQGYDEERRHAFEAALLNALGRSAGVRAAALTVNPPFGGVSSGDAVQHPTDAEQFVNVILEWVSPGYFDVLGARIIAGRPIGPEDLGASPGSETNVVISETLARSLFGSTPAVGRTVMRRRREPQPLRVVGVAADKRVRSLTSEPEAVLYEPVDASSRYSGWIVALVRTPLGLRDAEAIVRTAVDALDPALPLDQVERLSDKLERSVSVPRLFARLLTALASIALLMAAVGLYGVIAYSVSERTREIGIRMALGAQQRRVLLLVLKQAVVLVGIGTILGIAGALMLSRVIENRLFGVERLDPAIYAAAAILFGLVALAATAVPTHRATRVDPLIALRHE